MSPSGHRWLRRCPAETIFGAAVPSKSAARRTGRRGSIRPAWVRLAAVVLQLAPDEPEAGAWRAERLTAVIAGLMQLGRSRGAAGPPVVLAVDGRSSSGKSTLASRLADAVAGSAVVHTDDVAWQHSRFGWTDLLTGSILIPARAGQPVMFRPRRRGGTSMTARARSGYRRAARCSSSRASVRRGAKAPISPTLRSGFSLMSGRLNGVAGLVLASQATRRP